MAIVSVRVIGRNLPGRECEGRQAVHLGVQRGSDVIDIVPGDATEALFALSVEAVPGDDGAFDF
jgi:hypothetical protein